MGIADPLRPGRLALVVGASDCAVATSGTAERGPHILDPHTGQPASGLASLTIVGPSLALADAYATAAFAMGPARARDWTASLEGYAAFAITDNGRHLAHPGLRPPHRPRLTRPRLTRPACPRMVVDVTSTTLFGGGCHIEHVC